MHIFSDNDGCMHLAYLRSRVRLFLGGLVLAVCNLTLTAGNLPVIQATQTISKTGQDFTVFENVQLLPDGRTKTNHFTLLENGLNYQENGQWKRSEDLIESFEGGAIARRGPHRAIFSDELNVESVFDIEASDGKRIRGGLRVIQATDFLSGNTVVLGKVKHSVKGRLVPPNKIVYEDAFEGIKLISF